MREDSFVYKFDQGLRAKDESPRNSVGLELCHNLRPRNGRLSRITDIQTPSGASWTSVDDQLFCCQEINFLGCYQLGYILDSSMGVVTMMPTSVLTVPWSMADFGAYVLFTNGTTLYYHKDVSLDVYTAGDVPLCRSLCNFRGQLIGGSPTGYDLNVVLWGDIGRVTMTLADTVVAGYMPMPWQGYIHTVKPLGGYVAVYGSNGVALLKPTDTHPPGFGLVPISDMGVISAGAVAGGEYRHIYMRSDGAICSMEVDPVRTWAFQHKVLDFREWFSLWTQARISYDEAYEEFYLTDGNEGFLLTPEGLCSTHYLVTSCQRYYGDLWGMRALGSDTASYIKTQSFDGGLRGRKDTAVVEVGGSADWTTALHWRNTGSAIWNVGPSVATNPMGDARNKVSGEEFKLYLSSTASDASLDYATIRWNRPDKRFVRGMDASQAAARSNK